MIKEEWSRFWTLFHNAWGDCKESPEYDKKIWIDMQAMLKNEQEGK